LYYCWAAGTLPAIYTPNTEQAQNYEIEIPKVYLSLWLSWPELSLRSGNRVHSQPSPTHDFWHMTFGMESLE
jgi:hypothetical protein